MNRLEQDAADALQGHEDCAAFRDAERARWARAQPAVIGSVWAPKMSEQQKKTHEQYIAANNLPF